MAKAIRKPACQRRTNANHCRPEGPKRDDFRIGPLPDAFQNHRQRQEKPRQHMMQEMPRRGEADNQALRRLHHAPTTRVRVRSVTNSSAAVG